MFSIYPVQSILLDFFPSYFDIAAMGHVAQNRTNSKENITNNMLLNCKVNDASDNQTIDVYNDHGF